MAIEFEAQHSKIQPLLGDFALLHHARSYQQIQDREIFLFRQNLVYKKGISGINSINKVSYKGPSI